MKKLKIVIPKGRLNKKIVWLLNEIGLGIVTENRCYIPRVNNPDMEVKMMKPQNIPQLVEVGSHDVGFTGLDWVVETGAGVEEVMDLGFDPVQLVAAIPGHLSESGLRSKRIVAASEYESIATEYLDSKKYDYYFIRTFGATEVFPPEDADLIVDNVSTGRTLAEHNLKIIDCLMESTTRMIANKQALKNREKRAKINEMTTLMRAVSDAGDRVMLEMNIPANRFERIVGVLPCMRAPTVAPLYNNEGYAVKVAVKRIESATLIPKLKILGATDILEYQVRKVVI